MVDFCELGDLLQAPAARVLGLGPAEPVTLAAWRPRVQAWRQILTAHAGGAVAVFLPDPLEFAAVLWGAWYASTVPILAPDVQPVTVQRLHAHVQAWVGYGSDGLRPSVVHNRLSIWQALDPRSAELAIFTSGSTGEPVLVRKRLLQLQNEVEALERCFGAALGDAPVYTTVSHQHIYGLLHRILWPLAAGRPIYLESLAKRSPWPVLPRGILISSPAYLKRLPQPPPRAELAAVFSSGGELPAQAAQAAYKAWGCWPYEVYGSTETGGVAWRQGSDAWKPLPGVQVRLQAERLAVASPHLADAEWFVTQDRAELGEAGWVLRGRADRIAKVEEKRVSLTALEQRLMGSSWVQEARAVVLSGHRQVVGMAVVLNSEGKRVCQDGGKAAMNRALRTLLAAQFEPVVLPRRWHYVESLPTDTMGKVTEAQVARLFDAVLPTVDWRERHPERAEAEVEVTTDLRVFDGHFPGRPILPGVAQIHWAVTLARQVFALPGRVVGMEAIKFRRLIEPPCVVRLRLTWNGTGHTLTFAWLRDAQMHASGRIRFEAQHG